MFDDTLSGLKYFNNNFWAFVAEALNDNAADIVAINTDRIYSAGLDSEEQRLKNKYASYPIYSYKYEQLKTRKGLYQGYIDLHFTGEYLDAFRLEANENEVNIYVDASNADLDAVLQSRYGNDIQGLTAKEWEQVVNDFVMPVIIDELLKAIS